MIKDLGDNLKRLRKDKDLTQEELAEILNVSAQSISRWETNMGYPDIEMLPAIANFYGVSIDYLLGVDFNKKRERIAEISNKIMVLKTKGNREEAIKICREGLSQFPNEYQIMHLLASCLFNYGKSEEEKKANQQEVIEICENILSGCHDDAIRHLAILLLAYTYPHFDNLQKALDLANKMPNYYVTSNEILKNILKGEEKKRHVQGNLLSIVQLIHRNIEELFVLSNDYDEKVRILKVWINLFEVFFDEKDYYFYYCLTSPIFRYLGALYADKKMTEETLHCLKKAVEHAFAYDDRPHDYTYFSLLFKGYQDKIENSVTDSDINQKTNLLNKLNDQRYDFIRHDQRFIELINSLKR